MTTCRASARLLVIGLLAAGGFVAAWGTASGSTQPLAAGHLASDPPLTWSTPTNVDGSQRLAGVSCTSAALCVAVDSFHVVTSSNPLGGASAWTVTPIGIDDASSVSCAAQEPSSTLCVAVDCAPSAWWATNPTGGTGAWTQTSFGAPQCGLGRVLTGISCAGISTCVATDNQGHVLATAAPTGPSSGWQDTNADAGNAIQAISCPTASLCVAVDNAGNVVTSTQPTGAGANWQTAHIDGGALSSVSCSPAPPVCAAGDGAGNVLTSTNPTGGPGAWTAAHVDGSATLEGLSCPSATLCVGVDNQAGAILSTNPTAGVTAWTRQPIDTQVLSSVSCPSTSLCVAADWKGNVIVGSAAAGPPSTTTTSTTTSSTTTTSSATTTGASLPPPVPRIAIGDLSGQTTVDLNCPATASCGAVTLQFSVQLKIQGNTIVGVLARARQKVSLRRAVIATATVTLAAGQHKRVPIVLNATGKSLLARFRRLTAQMRVISGGRLVSTRSVKFAKRAKRPANKHHH